MTETRDPAIEALRSRAAIQEALAVLRGAVDTLAPAINRAMRLDGLEHWGDPERASVAQIKNGYEYLGKAIDYLVGAQRSLGG